MIAEDFLTDISSACALAKSNNIQLLRLPANKYGFSQYSLYLEDGAKPCVLFACPECESLDHQDFVCMKCGFNII